MVVGEKRNFRLGSFFFLYYYYYGCHYLLFARYEKGAGAGRRTACRMTTVVDERHLQVCTSIMVTHVLHLTLQHQTNRQKQRSTCRTTCNLN